MPTTGDLQSWVQVGFFQFKSRHMRTSILVDEKEEKFSFSINGMSEVTWTQLWRSYRAWPQKRRRRTDNDNFFYENDPHVWHWQAELWLVESQVLVVKPTSNVYGIELCLNCLNWSLCSVLHAFIHQLFDHTQMFKINRTWCKFAGFPIWRFTDWKCMKFSSGCSQVCASYLCRKKRSPSNCKKHKSPVQAASKTHQDISCPPCTVRFRFINKLEVLNYMVHLCN